MPRLELAEGMNTLATTASNHRRLHAILAADNRGHDLEEPSITPGVPEPRSLELGELAGASIVFHRSRPIK